MLNWVFDEMSIQLRHTLSLKIELSKIKIVKSRIGVVLGTATSVALKKRRKMVVTLTCYLVYISRIRKN